MNLVCSYISRIAVDKLVSGDCSEETSWVSRHIAGCADCRCALESARQLTTNLSELRLETHLSDQFSIDTWTRLQSAQALRVNGFLRLAPRTASFALAALVLAAYIARALFLPAHPPQSPSSGNQQVAVFQPDRSENQLRNIKDHFRPAPTDIKIAISAKQQSGAGARTKVPVRRPHKRRYFTKGRLMLALNSGLDRGPARKIKPVNLANQPKVDPVVAWTRWGAYYEYHGDYRSAEAAYAQALDKSRDPALVFSAGRAAECAGDVAQAVGFYTRILSQPSKTDNQPKKGSLLWTDEFDTA